MNDVSIEDFRIAAKPLLDGLALAQAAFTRQKDTFNFGLHLSQKGEGVILTNMFGQNEQPVSIEIKPSGQFIADMANAPHGQQDEIIQGEASRPEDVRNFLEQFRTLLNSNAYHYYR